MEYVIKYRLERLYLDYARAANSFYILAGTKRIGAQYNARVEMMKIAEEMEELIAKHNDLTKTSSADFRGIVKKNE